MLAIVLAALSFMVAIGPVAAQQPGIPPDILESYRTPPAVTTASEATLRLGKALFFDPILSGNESASCATCHNPGLSWGNGLPRAIGDQANVMGLRAPTLIDIGALPLLGWDGKFPSIEAVTFPAMTSAANMNLPAATALSRLRGNAGYVAMFREAFSDQGITRETVELAIGAYQRTIIARDAPFDRFVSGDTGAISVSAVRGFVLFNGAANCAQCHGGWAFTDGSFHDVGTATGDDIGRGRLFPSSVKLRYAFKTPTLRDVAHRAPYMHDGSIGSLREVLALYERGGIDRPSRSELMTPLKLTEQDRLDLLAFLDTLTERPVPVVIPTLPR